MYATDRAGQVKNQTSDVSAPRDFSLQPAVQARMAHLTSLFLAALSIKARKYKGTFQAECSIGLGNNRVENTTVPE